MSKKGCKCGPYGLGHKSNNKQDKSEDKVCDDYSHQQIVKRLKNQLMKRAEESNELQGRNRLPEEEEKEMWPFQNVFMEEEVLEALDTDNSSEFEHVEPDIFSDIAEDILTDFPTCTQPDKDETPLYEGASTNFGTFMLLISLFVSKHNLTGDAVHQLLQIFSYILLESNCVENTLYSFKKYFTTLKAVLKHHRYCPKCLNYVKDSSVIKCQNENCQHSFESITMPYFIEVPILDQLKSLFSQKGFFNSLQGRFCFNESQNSDVYDGRVYKNMFENNGPLSVPENISFILNTDGAPVFKSSSVSVWPLFLTINEPSLRQRFMPENMILAGLWFGTLKPAMCTFLKPFVSSMKALCSGIEMYSPDRGLFTCKAFLLGVTADLPAKALLCNSVQYIMVLLAVGIASKRERLQLGEKVMFFPSKKIHLRAQFEMQNKF